MINIIVTVIGSSGFDDPFIIPFKPVRCAKRESSMTVNEDIFRETVDMVNLWCPMEKCSHDRWVTNLVCTILKTFPQENCFMSQLVPVCSTKVSMAVALTSMLQMSLQCGISY